MSEEEFIHLPPEKTIIQYLNRKRKKAGLSEIDIGEALSLDQSNVSRLLNEDRRLRYNEAHEIVLLILKHISSLPNETVDKYYTKSAELVYSDDPILLAAKKMRDNGFTQLPVKDRRTEKCVGIVTDRGFLSRMLNPIKTESKLKWLEELRNMRIDDADVIDKVPTYPSNSFLIEVAEGLMRHYAVLIEEDERKNPGIITRADFLELLIQK
jgi:predicted transcriptional regulator